jgi:hypothetical protein
MRAAYSKYYPDIFPVVTEKSPADMRIEHLALPLWQVARYLWVKAADALYRTAMSFGCSDYCMRETLPACLRDKSDGCLRLQVGLLKE